MLLRDLSLSQTEPISKLCISRFSVRHRISHRILSNEDVVLTDVPVAQLVRTYGLGRPLAMPDTGTARRLPTQHPSGIAARPTTGYSPSSCCPLEDTAADDAR